MSKVLEKIINIQFYDYFESNHLFYKSQYGFRKQHSTEFASLDLVDTIQQLDLKLDPFALFLDMSKAVHTLYHEILLHKLSRSLPSAESTRVWPKDRAWDHSCW